MAEGEATTEASVVDPQPGVEVDQEEVEVDLQHEVELDPLLAVELAEVAAEHQIGGTGGEAGLYRQRGVELSRRWEVDVEDQTEAVAPKPEDEEDSIQEDGEDLIQEGGEDLIQEDAAVLAVEVVVAL